MNGKFSKISNFSLSVLKILVFRAEVHNMLVRIANREDPDQTASANRQSDLGLHCLSRPYW